MNFNNVVSRIVEPRSVDEDARRREFILNVLVLGSIILLAVALGIDVIHLFSQDQHRYENMSLSFVVIGVVLGFFITLYVVSRSGYARLGSYLLLSSLFLLATYLCYVWGFDVPAAGLFYALTIVMAGILIHTYAALGATFIICVTLVLLGHAQLAGILSVNSYWKLTHATYSDIIMTMVVFGIIASVAWLGNREIEKSLVRARRSEQELKVERDMLEMRVAERTEELRKAELERMSQAYRFVEFGRLAGSVFHDLASPLTALSLNIDSIAKGAGDRKRIATFADDIAQAQSATTHMQKLMESMRRHLAREGGNKTFSLSAALSEALHVLGSYARSRSVAIGYQPTAAPSRHGDPIAFLQIVTNIVTNAIESFPPLSGAPSSDTRMITITLREEAGRVVLSVSDTGPGMSEEVRARIFEPFFSTKGVRGGLGIGLPLACRLIEKSFGGSIEVESELERGTTFTLYFP